MYAYEDPIVHAHIARIIRRALARQGLTLDDMARRAAQRADSSTAEPGGADAGAAPR